MCDEDIPRTCKQRFKGIENFLRRVAFNLGNTASQTEVKIISCIPIDVTDLQQKIINLEKELHDAKEAKEIKDNSQPNATSTPGKSTGVFNTSVVETSVRARCTDPKTKDTRSNHSSCCDNCTSNLKQSNISFVFSALSHAEQKEGLEFCRETDTRSKETKPSDKGKNIFRRRKKKTGKEESRRNTQFVYYAEASHAPFVDMHSTYLPKKILPTERRDIESEHLSKVMRKQYDPKFGIEQFSDTSDFSRPICNDLTNPIRYESDICSCCHGRFQNIDDYMGKGFNYFGDSSKSYAFDYTSSNKTYYDSDLYDIVPVRDISGKTRHDFSYKDETKKYIDINCWPETIRTKQRLNPVTLSYRAEIPTIPSHRYFKRMPTKLGNPHHTSSSKRPKLININHKMNEDNSKTCSIECGVVYTKPIIQTRVAKKHNHTISHEMENNQLKMNTDENQIKRCKSIQLGVNLLNDTNTEMMLEQIKSILQSVLAEVKTNTKLNKEEKPKRDAIVQKGSSHNYMPGCSTLLNSFTYNASHNANSYFTPYSPHMPSRPLCYASIPYQPAQNLQYLLHPCYRHQTNSCQYQNNTVLVNRNKPVNIAINTDGRAFNSSSKETNNLIKDIYKSVALNMEYPTKESSKSESENLRSSDNVSTNKSQTKSATRSESDVVKTDKEIEAYLSSGTGNPLHTTLQYAETSSQAEDKSETKMTTTRDMKKGRANMTTNSQAFNLYRLEERRRQQSNAYPEQEETDVSSDGEESDGTVVPNTEVNKGNKPKKGLLHRFFTSVKLLKRRKRSRRSEQEDEEDDECQPSEDSESEDYETMYSESINQSQYASTPVNPAYVKKSAPINIQLNGKRITRSPYMEQEERRHWNEMFQEKHKYCPGRPSPSRSMRSQHHRSPYRKNYEVRSVIVDDKIDRRNYQNDRVDQNCRTDRVSNTMKEKGFLKKRKGGLGCKCGERFKNLILEN